MRFRTLAAVLTFVFLTPAAAFAFAFSRTLCLGDAGTAVANLQQFLIDDGDGTLTRVAVIHFQTEQGLTPIDCTGPLARARINAIEAQHPEYDGPLEQQGLDS